MCITNSKTEKHPQSKQAQQKLCIQDLPVVEFLISGFLQQLSLQKCKYFLAFPFFH